MRQNPQVYAGLSIVRFLKGVVYGTLAAVVIAPSAQLAFGSGISLSFDGVDDRVLVGQGLFREVTNTFTIEIWVNPSGGRVETLEANSGVTGIGAQRYAIFPDQGQQAYGDPNAGAGVSVGTNGVSVFEHAGDYLPSLLVYTNSVSGWTHVAVVYSNSQPRLYVNGNLVRTGLVSGRRVHPSANMGDSGNGYGFYRGLLDEVRVWNVALDSATIQVWKDQEVGSAHPNYPNLVGYWRLNEGAGTNAQDWTGSGHDGVLQNGPIWVSPGAPVSGRMDPIVVTDSATEVTNTSARLNGAVNPQGSDTIAWFEWGTTNFDFSTAPQSVGGGTMAVPISAGISGLIPVQTYRYRLLATNSAGFSIAGSTQFTTAGPPSATTLTADSVTLTNAVLQAMVTPNGLPTTAWFEWGATTNYGVSTVAQSAGTNFASTNLSAALNGLMPGLEYHFRIVASNGCGLSAGQDQRFWTQVFTNGVVLLKYLQGRVYWGDFNNDGWSEPLALVDAYTNAGTFLFMNRGGTFTNVPTTLPLLVLGEAAWGDYSGDGRKDLLLSGLFLGSTSTVCRIYRNEDEGVFTDIGASLPVAVAGGVAWGDFDNDGDLDLAVCGNSSYYIYGTVINPIARIYRNDGGMLTDIGANLPGVGNGSVAWGDYDNDGQLDLLVAGDTGTGCVARVYQNNNGTFTDIGAGLTGVASGSAAWGDYDGDGWLDISLAGTTSGSRYGAVCRIYRNNHDGTFTDINADLPGVYQGTASWGDYDNDGSLDILLTSIADYGIPQARVYRNIGGGFSDVGAGLPPYSAGAGAWGDYDNDGKLDVAMAGASDHPFAGVDLMVFRNCLVPTNTPANRPSAPGSLTAFVTNNGVKLTWSAGTDPHAPAPGLTYNVRIGTAPGGGQVLSSESDSVTGWLRVPQMGNAQHRLFTTITNLPIGIYHWSVQTVNNSFVASAWAAEQVFAVISGAPMVIELSSEPDSVWLLKCAGTARREYVVEASTNLDTWTALTNLIAQPDGTFEFRDTQADNLAARFYRLKAL